MRHCEFKKRYDSETDQYVREQIYGEGIIDSIKSLGSKLFGKTAKKAASKAAFKAVSKVSEKAAEKAGDKIVQLLQKTNKQTNKGKTVEMPSIPINI